MALLDVRDLHIAIAVGDELLPVVQGVSFSVDKKQTLGIVGESGCGKSLTSLAIMGLTEGTPILVTDGSIRFDGRELLELSIAERRKIMGDQMAMIFQEPMTSLNPVYRIGEQISEMILQHRHISKKDARARVIDLLELVRIDDPHERVDSYPHQMSGGQRQRVMIAMALACDPRLLIADEPTTALDATVQKGVLDLMLDLQQRNGTAIILISHDLGVIAETCDQTTVMYRGKIVEAAPTRTLFAEISHPYTRGLLNSLPAVDYDTDRLDAIPGRVPTINETLPGCPFHPRCNKCEKICLTNIPPKIEVSKGHYVRCHFADGTAYDG